MKLKKHNLKITDFGHIAQDCVWSLQYWFARPLCMWGAIPAGLLPDILTCRMSLMKLKSDIHSHSLGLLNNTYIYGLKNWEGLSIRQGVV